MSDHVESIEHRVKRWDVGVAGAGRAALGGRPLKVHGDAQDQLAGRHILGAGALPRPGAVLAVRAHGLAAVPADELRGVVQLDSEAVERGGPRHRVQRGAADRSFGVHVAKLAGLPATVVKRAEDLLRVAEKTAKAGPSLPLFNAAPAQEVEAELNPALELLNTIEPDTLSPKEALEILYKLKGLS